MVVRVCLGVVFATIGAVAAAAQTAPAGLREKSFIVTWSEERTQRVNGGPTRQVQIPMSLSVYVSSAGRPFSRRTAVSRRGQVGEQDKIGAGGSNGEGAARKVEFHGSSAVVTNSFRGGARRIQVEFGADFGSCSARVSVAMEVGAGTARLKSIVTGADVEVLGMAASGASCSVRNGNVFG